jgi:mannitol/fructose-specific phosphotransferase system IIA component (Ntr-type)
MAKIVQLARDPDFVDRLGRLERPEEFLQLLEERLI